MATNTTSLEQLAHQGGIPAAAKALSTVSDWRSAGTLALQWAIIFAAIGAAMLARNWLVDAAAILVIAARQQAFGVLLHEAAHFRLFRNRALNDLASDLFCALPIGLLTQRYRADHLRHHIEPNGPRDPYWLQMLRNPRGWEWPKSPRAAAAVVLRDLAGPSVIDFFTEWASWGPWANHFSRRDHPSRLTWASRCRVYAYYLLVGAATIRFGLYRELFLLWLLPTATVSQALFRIRSLAEHRGLLGDPGNDRTRNVISSPIERFFVAPLNVNHHLTHHIYPAVPWYHLPELTALITANPEFRRLAPISPNYLGRNGVLRAELIQRGAGQERQSPAPRSPERQAA